MKYPVFRVSSSSFHLTYKTYINPNIWIEEMEKRFSKIKEYSIVHEKGDEINNYMHTHIYVDFSEKVESKRSTIFNFKLEDDNQYWTDSFWEEYRKDKDEKKTGIHPHIQIVKNLFHRNAIISYHKKGEALFFKF
jgi:hypothetical protein